MKKKIIFVLSFLCFSQMQMLFSQDAGCPKLRIGVYLNEIFAADTSQQGGKINWMDKEWRAYDVNADGKFDKQDIEQLLDDGWQTFSSDLNYDGKKDVSDVFALFVKLSVLDRNCDEAVDDEDFKPLTEIELPEPDEEKIWFLVNEIVPTARVKAPLPVDIEQKLFETIDDAGIKSVEDRAYVYQAAGVSALI